MPNAYFTLIFDPELEQGVRAVWKDLETIGIRYEGGERYRPHITLTGLDLPDPDACTDTLRTLCSRHPPLPIRLHHIGVFPELSVLFLTPRITRALLDLQHDVVREVSRLPGVSPPFPHYDADAWAQHCTLAVNVPPNLLGNAVTRIQSQWRVLEGTAIGIGLFVPPIKTDRLQERFSGPDSAYVSAK